MSGEFWIGFFYGAIAVGLPSCLAALWALNRRIRAQLMKDTL